MSPKIALIILILSGAVVFPFMPVSADPATPLETPLIEENSAAIPPQLKPPTEDVSKLDETEEFADEKLYDIPMVLNDSVESHLEYFTNRGRDRFQLWLDRSARYTPMMKDIFREKNLPEDLIYVALIESGFNPYAVSWCKAVGAWQFMPGTAKLYGLKIDWWIDERKDPIKSTQAAAELLKDLHGHFGSWPLALASYNAGAGKVQRAVLRTRSDDFWDLKASRFIKPETKNYIPKYMAATIIAKNPAGYGFTPDNRQQPLKYDEVTLEESADLRLIARCAECTYEELKELNPELKRWVTPPHFDKYILRIPPGKKDIFLANFTSVPPEQKIKWERHEVKKGETLAGLAKKYNTTAGAIRDVNGLRKNKLPPGKHILIPVDMNGTTDAGYLNTGQASRPQEILYRVRRGETLVKIAKKHDISVADIKEWNKGIGNSVRTGQKIKLILDVNQI